MKTVKLLFFSFFLLVLYSCRSVPKDIAYLQGIDDYKDKLKELSLDDKVYKFQDQDQLIISVSSPEPNQERVAQFNLPANSFLSAGETQLRATGSIQTYVVDSNGDIYFPVLGKIHVEGKTRVELRDYLVEKLKKYIVDPIVSVNIDSAFVTVLGEVESPGRISYPGEKMTIFDALGGVEDLTIYGNRKNVLLLRETDNHLETARIDLTDPEIIFSPYFYLKQRDLIVVEPNATKKKSANYGVAENYNLSMISLLFTAVSLISSLFLMLKTK
ncbi:MAG: polysaccharide biosynthesis/export family protein [Dysgonamonadaceae bacterium]|nr:polysaccharide biosynthesis/export family protein [Dysgonamonadaceae bacterium]